VYITCYIIAANDNVRSMAWGQTFASQTRKMTQADKCINP